MWIEQRPLQLAPFEMKQKGKDYQLTSGGRSALLSDRQYQYFDQLRHGKNLHDLVKDFVTKGWLVSFREIFAMMDSLVQAGIIINPEFHSFFTLARTPIHATGSNPPPQKNSARKLAEPQHLKSLPFFRNLHPDLQKVFIENASIKSLPANTQICKTGEHSRELFALLDGMAGIYRSFGDNRRQLLSTISPGALFGEGGFLLNRPRGADIITLAPSSLLVIQHSDAISDFIDSGRAEVLQKRFWVLNGLLSSDVFSQLPTETLDALVFAGSIREIKENTVIMREGEPGQSFFILVQGTVTVSQKGQTLRSSGQGAIFGEVALMVSGGVRTATIQAQRDCLLLEIQMTEFFDVLSNHLLLAKTLEEIAWTRYSTRIK